FACEGTRVHIYEIVFSPDGKLVAASQIRKEISICSAKTGKLLHKLKAKDEEISGLAHAPTGEILRSCWCSEIEVFDSKTGKLLPPLRVNDDDISVDAMALFRNGTRLAAVCDENASVWSWPQRQLLFRFKAGGWLPYISASPDGKTLAISAEDKGVEFFDAANGKRYGLIRGKECKKHVFTPDGSHFIISHDDTEEISICNTSSYKQICRFPLKDGAFVLAVSPDGRYLGAATNRGAFVWRLGP